MRVRARARSLFYFFVRVATAIGDQNDMGAMVVHPRSRTAASIFVSPLRFSRPRFYLTTSFFFFSTAIAQRESVAYIRVSFARTDSVESGEKDCWREGREDRRSLGIIDAERSRPMHAERSAGIAAPKY